MNPDLGPRTFSTDSVIEFVVTDPDAPEALRCLASYFAELDKRFGGGGAASASPAGRSDLFRPPAGVFLVVVCSDESVGCVGLKLHGDGPAEIKRMWLDARMRGLGIGRRLLAEVERRAVEAGARSIRLETNRALHEAITLYRSAGFVAVEAFNDEKCADHWFEKPLRPSK